MKINVLNLNPLSIQKISKKLPWQKRARSFSPPKDEENIKFNNGNGNVINNINNFVVQTNMKDVKNNVNSFNKSDE